MKAIVHIGSPKAGSSSIQEFLFLNRTKLAEQGFRFKRNVHGRGSQYEYPLALLARNGRLIHGEQERALYKARSVAEVLGHSDKYLKALQSEAQKTSQPVALFSSEHILPWLTSVDLVRAFDQQFQAAFADVRYLVYYRAPDAALLSQYSERIKRGYTHTLDAFVAQRLKGLNIFRSARRWADAVSKGRMEVRLFDRSTLKDGDAVADYCDACGIDATGLTMPPRTNEALSAPAAECLRILNGIVPELRPNGSRNPLRADLLQAVQELSADMPKLTLNQAQQQMVRHHMGTPLEKLRKQFFPDRERLFPAPQEAPDQTDDQTQEMALHLMAQLLIKTRMGELSTLNFLERQRAYMSEPLAAPTQANDVAAPKTAAPPSAKLEVRNA